jgi:FkbM family methyltransferase
MQMDRLHIKLARMIMRVWPFPFAHIRLMKLLNPPPVPESRTVCRLRGYPVSIKSNPQTYIGRYLYFRGMYEEQVIRKMSGLLHPGMTFLDVGANIGLHTVIAAHKVGKAGAVISIEPQAAVYRELCDNINLNGQQWVSAYRCALGRKNEQRNIYQINKRNSGQATLALDISESSCDSESVEVRTLNSVAKEARLGRIDGVKIDVEGAEMEVLLGASEYFEETGWPRFMLIECIERHLKRFGTSSKEVIEFLSQHHYKIYCLHQARWEPIIKGDGLQADILAIRG